MLASQLQTLALVPLRSSGPEHDLTSSAENILAWIDEVNPQQIPLVLQAAQRVLSTVPSTPTDEVETDGDPNSMMNRRPPNLDGPSGHHLDNTQTPTICQDLQ